ncbi:DUF3995 domain-containing protein [Dactylosporangium sp. NPDC000555]|uniref:DUF3995 domain-containing protein n=1 Tax=Dactylosporangium sp. NPDC000555 TaxID=3154260 RepID=UPI00332B5380
MRHGLVSIERMSPAGARTRRGIRRPALLAAVWAVAFAVAHVYWALGGRVLLAMSFRGAANAAAVLASPPLRFAALWGVGVLCLAGAGIAVLLGRPEPPPGRGTLRRVLRVLAWAAAVALLLRGGLVAAQDALIAAGVLSPQVAGGAGELADVAHWSLGLFCPWFLTGGVLFALTARRPR